mmetsp:Transcript_115521/g.337953  ORF Transcript_115521/g.337953 Transcript_115521/m.337953 type:complete len:205 (-) Transcript_115521:1787-2401(-)
MVPPVRTRSSMLRSYQMDLSSPFWWLWMALMIKSCTVSTTSLPSWRYGTVQGSPLSALPSPSSNFPVALKSISKLASAALRAGPFQCSGWRAIRCLVCSLAPIISSAKALCSPKSKKSRSTTPSWQRRPHLSGHLASRLEIICRQQARCRDRTRLGRAVISSSCQWHFSPPVNSLWPLSKSMANMSIQYLAPWRPSSCSKSNRP